MVRRARRARRMQPLNCGHLGRRAGRRTAHRRRAAPAAVGRPVFAEGSDGWQLHPSIAERVQPEWKRSTKAVASGFADGGRRRGAAGTRRHLGDAGSDGGRLRWPRGEHCHAGVPALTRSAVESVERAWFVIGSDDGSLTQGSAALARAELQHDHGDPQRAMSRAGLAESNGPDDQRDSLDPSRPLRVSP